MSVDRIAPRDKFRVIAVDTFDGTEWIHRDCDSEEEAFMAAKEKGGTMIKTHVYDDCGKHLKEDGKF